MLPRCWASQSSLTFPTLTSFWRRRNSLRSTTAISPTDPVHNTTLKACPFTPRRGGKSHAALDLGNFRGFAVGRDGVRVTATRPSIVAYVSAVAADLRGGPAAVNQDVGAGDKPGFFGAEKQRQFADFLHVAPSANWNLRDELRVQFRVVQNGPV